MNRIIAIAAATFAAFWGTAAWAVTIDFTGGTAYLNGGGTFVPNNASSASTVDYYEQAGYLFDFIGDYNDQIVGDYYSAGDDSLHAHFKGYALTEVRGKRTDNSVFDLDSLVVTTNTIVNGGNALGTEDTYLNASYDGVTIGYSQLLPSEDWGRATTTLVTLGSQFDNIQYFSITAGPTVSCVGFDGVTVSDALGVPEPQSVVLALGLVGLAAGACRVGSSGRRNRGRFQNAA